MGEAFVVAKKPLRFEYAGYDYVIQFRYESNLDNWRNSCNMNNKKLTLIQPNGTKCLILTGGPEISAKNMKLFRAG